MLYILSAHVKQGQLRSYQDWLRENRADLESKAPEGWTLRGVYFTVFGLGEYMNEIHWELADYGSFEASAAQDREDVFGRLVEELYDFLDLANHRGRLLKDAFDEGTVVVAK